MAQLFDYRLVEVTYKNRLEWEDGPGSLRNVVSDKSEEVIDSWDDQDEDFGKQLLEEGDPTLELLPDEPDGWIEYSYRLEWWDETSQRWRLVGFLRS